MDIEVFSPGSPGSSLTDGVKKKILQCYDALHDHDDFKDLKDFKSYMTTLGVNENYLRNILPFLQYLGIVRYEKLDPFINGSVFTDIGCAYVATLKTKEIVENEPDSETKQAVIDDLDRIDKAILFQCLVIMMKDKTCSYSVDFWDVLRFVNEYESIDATEYLLLLYAREKNINDYLNAISNNVIAHRDDTEKISVKTITNKGSKAKIDKVNSFPYVSGNFIQAGIFKKDNKNRFYINDSRRTEIDVALREIELCRK